MGVSRPKADWGPSLEWRLLFRTFVRYIYQMEDLDFYSMLVRNYGSLFFFADRFLIPSVRALFTNGISESDAAGDDGTYRIIEGKRFVYWNGDLWAISPHEEEEFRDGQTISITSSENGKFTIKK
jgi:hypothetical protein